MRRTKRLRTLTVGIAVSALLATGCEWHFETLDGHRNGPNGEMDNISGFDQAALTYNGRPHVFYRADNPATNDDVVRHAYYNGQFWAFETLDGTGGANGRVNAFVGDYISAIIYNGRPHIFYYDLDNGNLRHGYYNGQFWAFEVLDGAGGPNGRLDGDVGENTMVVLYDGRPHVFYRDLEDFDLRHGYWNGVAWAFETLDGHQNGPTGQIDANVMLSNGAVVIYNGRPHVFYRDGTNGDLRHGYYNGAAWVFETLDGHQNGPNGRLDADLGGGAWSVILYGGNPRVFYQDETTGGLRLAYYTGSLWGFETLDGSGGSNGRIDADVGDFTTAVPYNGRPDVFYHDDTNDDLRHAWFG